MPAENRDVRGNEIKPAVAEISDKLIDPGGTEHTDGVASAVDAITDGDGVDRQIWVIANGAADPADATADDLIFEESA